MLRPLIVTLLVFLWTVLSIAVNSSKLISPLLPLSCFRMKSFTSASDRPVPMKALWRSEVFTVPEPSKSRSFKISRAIFGLKSEKRVNRRNNGSRRADNLLKHARLGDRMAVVCVQIGGFLGLGILYAFTENAWTSRGNRVLQLVISWRWVCSGTTLACTHWPIVVWGHSATATYTQPRSRLSEKYHGRQAFLNHTDNMEEVWVRLTISRWLSSSPNYA